MAVGSYMWSLRGTGDSGDPNSRFVNAASGATSATFNSVLTVGDSCIVVIRLESVQTITPSADFTFLGSSGFISFFAAKILSSTSASFSWPTPSGVWAIANSFVPMGLGGLSSAQIGMTYGAVGEGLSDLPTITPGGNNATVIAVRGASDNATGSAPSGYGNATASQGFSPSYSAQVASTYQSTAAPITAYWGLGSPGILVAFYPINPPATITPLKANGAVAIAYDYWERLSGVWARSASSSSNTHWQFVDETITSLIADGDIGLGQAAGASATKTLTHFLTDTPSDFVSMQALSIRYSTALAGTYVDDSGLYTIVIYKSDNTTILSNLSLNLDYFTGSSWNTNSASLSPPGYNKVVSLGLSAAGLAATKADWDNANIVITFQDVTAMGNDSAAIILVDFELIATYVPDVTIALITPIGSKSVTTSKMGVLTGTAIVDYIVEYRTTAGPGAWTRFADGVNSATGATITGLTPTTSYDFRVAAVNGFGTGLWSNITTVTSGAGAVKLKFGDTQVSALKFGDTAVAKAYLGDTLIIS